jgi:pimeloyl-ACP methyl ester carboxylesterase
MKEVRAGLETVRPGRRLFVREWLLGVEEGSDLSAKTKATDLQILWVHGSCATEKQFHLLLLSLEAKVAALTGNPVVHCILFDAVGCGQSPVPADYSSYATEELVQDIRVVAQTFLDPQIPTVWAGHSYAPNLLVRLLLKEQQGSAPTTGSSSSPSGQSEKKELPTPHAFVFLATAFRGSESSQKPFPDGGLSIFALPVWILNCLQYWMTLSFVNSAIHPKHTWLRNECLSTSNANSMLMVRSFYRQTQWCSLDDAKSVVGDRPCLVVHGVNDGVLALPYGQALANAIGERADLCAVDQASHLVMIEQADRVAQRLLEFLQTHFLSEK